MWKQPQGPLTDEQINRMWSSHSMEYYSALKRKETLTCAPARMNLGDITLSSPKDKCCPTFTLARSLSLQGNRSVHGVRGSGVQHRAGPAASQMPPGFRQRLSSSPWALTRCCPSACWPVRHSVPADSSKAPVLWPPEGQGRTLLRWSRVVSEHKLPGSESSRHVSRDPIDLAKREGKS